MYNIIKFRYFHGVNAMENNEINETLVALGQKIYQARKAAKMSRAELGKLVGLHETTVKRYEDGDIKSPNYTKIEAFAEVLHINVQDLVNTWIPGKPNENEKITYTIFRPIGEDDFHAWQKLMDRYWELNDAGQLKVQEYVKDLASHPDYKRTEPAPGAFHYKELD